MALNRFYKKLPALDISTHGEGEEGQDFPLIKEASTYYSYRKHYYRSSHYLFLSTSLSTLFTIIRAFLLITAYTIIKPTNPSYIRQLSLYYK
jgi:hypothetical protein